MLNMVNIEENEQRGLTFVGSQRHVKANSKNVYSNYAQKKETNYILYSYANKLIELFTM